METKKAIERLDEEMDQLACSNKRVKIVANQNQEANMKELAYVLEEDKVQEKFPPKMQIRI